MQNQLTPDGAIFLAVFAIAALCVLIYVLLKVIFNKDGITILPDPLLFGWGGAAWIPGIVLLAKSHAGNAALIAHDRCHLEQIERDGRLVFSIKYLYWLCRYGYQKCPYEVEARAAEWKDS